MVRVGYCMFAAARKDYRQFIDSLRVYVRGGTGGQGLAKYNGIGGRGGNVYLVGDDYATFKKLCHRFPTRRFVASNGDDSSARALQGAPGSPLDITVPTGVCVKTDFGTVLGEVNRTGDRVLLASGGLGGCISNSFVGQKGESLSLNLDLKLISDIGLVGFPNAGKSTLLKAMSRASPKIASYPFTTIQPQLGIIEYEDHRQISMADLPGLVEGAHVNVGMGHKFLKHVERTKLLLFVVDVHGFRLSVQHSLRSAFENILLLNKELELYNIDLVSKPAVLVLNKMDVSDSEQLYQRTLECLNNIKESASEVTADVKPQHFIKFDEIIAISAKQRTNIEELKLKLRHLLDLYVDIEQNNKNIVEKRFKQLEQQTAEHHGRGLV